MAEIYQSEHLDQLLGCKLCWSNVTHSVHQSSSGVVEVWDASATFASALSLAFNLSAQSSGTTLPYDLCEADMECRASDSTFDDLMYRLAAVNAKLQDDDQGTLETDLRERQKIMQLIVQARRRTDYLIGFD